MLVVTQRAEQLTDAERRDSLEASTTVLNAHGREHYAMVLDNRRAGPLPATQRKMIADYMTEHSMRARSRCVCMAMVMDSMVMRAMLTAIMWLRKPEVESQVFADLGEAITWARSKLQAADGARASVPTPAR